MQRPETPVWGTQSGKCPIGQPDGTVLDVLTANTHQQLLTEADKICIHAQESWMTRVSSCVCRLPISQMHDTAVGWGRVGWGGVGIMVSGSLTTGQMYCITLGKQKGQGRDFRWMSASLWCLEHGAVTVIILLHSAPSEVT